LHSCYLFSSPYFTSYGQKNESALAGLLPGNGAGLLVKMTFAASALRYGKCLKHMSSIKPLARCIALQDKKMLEGALIESLLVRVLISRGGNSLKLRDFIRQHVSKVTQLKIASHEISLNHKLDLSCPMEN